MRSSRSNLAQVPTRALVVAALVVAAIVSGTEPATTHSSPEAELRAAETAFAKTMADRDHKAFMSFLDAETIFFSPGEIRGSSAVAAAWKPYFEAEGAPFSWQPKDVAVLDSGDLGLSSGPVLAPDGTRVGTFNSVWRRQEDGSWKIIFDRGCPPCGKPNTARSD